MADIHQKLKEFLKKYGWEILLIILVLIIHTLIIGKTDIYSDNSLNSFRAFGWVDYFGGGQVGPLQTLGHTLWWTRLSFQDAPPLVFFIQYLFFKIFGGTTFAAQLPFALAGIGSVWALYYFVKKLKDRNTALIASCALAISSYAIWASIAGYLEGVEVFFITISFLSIAMYIKDFRTRYLYLGAIFLGLALISKYTAIFLIPTYLLIIYITHHKQQIVSVKVSKKRIYSYWKALGATCIVLLPVIIYNIFLHRARGHFDSAFSSIFGMNAQDFGGIGYRYGGFDPLAHLFQFFSTLFATSSFPFVLACLLSIVWLCIKAYRRRADMTEQALLTALFFLVWMFIFLGPDQRFLSIGVPFLVLALGISLMDGIRYFHTCTPTKTTNSVFLLIFLGFIIGIFGFEGFYSFNTNVLSKSIGRVGVFSASEKNQSLGFNELDSYLHSVFAPLPQIHIPKTASELDMQNLNEYSDSHIVVIYDTRLNWFATWWYFQRYRMYYQLPIFSSATEIRTELFPKFSYSDVLHSATPRTIYFIYPLNKNVMTPESQNDDYYKPIDIFALSLDDQHVPATIIKNRNGDPAFKVYEIKQQ